MNRTIVSYTLSHSYAWEVPLKSTAASQLFCALFGSMF